MGYSSIVYLQRLPIDVLKIDRAFVSGLPTTLSCRAIVGLVVGLGESLGMRVTAEGIETEAQRACLLELGCPRGQGFLFDRPVDAGARSPSAWRSSESVDADPPVASALVEVLSVDVGAGGARR